MMRYWKQLIILSGLSTLMVGCKSQDGVLPLVEVVEMPEEQIEKVLGGLTSDEIEEAWGAPAMELSGMDGAVFELDDHKGSLTVYYGNDDRSVVAVKRLEEEQSQSVERNIEQMTAQAILASNRKRYTGEECAGEGHVILKTEETDKKLVVYALTMYGEYQFQDNHFVKEAGSGVIPAVITFSKKSDNTYELESFRHPDDGSGYIESIEKMFPKELWNLCISPTEEIQSQLKAMEQSYARAYLKDLGREAEIGEYRDFEHPLLTDMGVSVAVSNLLIENKDLSQYPYWVGNIERLEMGNRYVYTLEVDQENKKIRFIKTMYGKENVLESFEFDLGTGQPILEEGKGEAPTLNEENILKEPPSLKLMDALSSTWNEFKIEADTASWNYKQGDSMVGFVSCGQLPLGAANKKEHLKLPEYNRMDYVSYLVSCSVQPDRITVVEYDIADTEDLKDAQPVSQKAYEDVQIIELKPQKGYAITAEWDKEHLETYGFYGTGHYSVITD